ncbi:thiamine ABC transporter ATP-binding protein [Roseicyclus sp.]|uniref:thiamine ABC transporter ATP-binding protein n=1 Tax=Roseicyclus sp. TaxID=1914329 RepID=UPI003F9F1039
MLRLEGVDLSLGAFRLALDAEVPAGGRVAVLGASGSGKSTLLSLLAGFHAPDRGRISWKGEDLTDVPPAARPMSILFQDGNLFPHLTVVQNVGLGLRPDLRLSREERARVEATLARVGLGGMAGRRPADLSGGQQGRVALARILLRDRPVALLDEPFAALDPALRTEMLALLEALWRERGMTFVMATHDLRDAERLCDRVWLLEAGRVILDRPVAGLRDDAPEALRDWF